ncbi:DUF4047 domain-containing protein [Rossellomorea vietnamensis]|uniref:DUF4047 domain-containing protein n=1 Tax=Rossellomorea vietnamensis TaxID=218284 RepID=UPI001CCCC131|nr:DUF4047 domain-containing protein [Rossellomorea vietnamensis]MCA0150427.1 DUF4047 domain-containing protein [Rossellomorea vietnamensis]
MRRIHQRILLPSLCCIAFYSGTQLIGETEAAFTSQASPDSITMNAAFVFPATIHELEDRAQRVAESMEHNMKTISALSSGSSGEEFQRQLDQMTAIEKELTHQMDTMHKLYEEVSTYYREIQKQEVKNVHTYDYVREGFEHVEGMLKGVQATVEFSKIEEIRSSILMQIQELEDQEQPSVEGSPTDPAPEQPQTNPDPDHSESQNEGSREITNEVKTDITEEASKDNPNDKQVTEHEEENVGDSE